MVAWGRTIRVAAGQMLAQDIAHAGQAFDVIARLADRARRDGVELLVLPECAYPAYWLGSAKRCRADDILRTPAVLDRLSAVAAECRLHLVCGIVEEADDRLYNAAAVFDPAGALVGIARKTFLWDCDNRWFTPGDAIRVFDTTLGRLGVLICADARAPETVATLAAQRAEVLAMPTAWVNVCSTPGTLYNIQPDFLIESRAREFGLPFVCADKAGPEPPLEYVGQSLIVTAVGRVQQRAAIEGEALIVGELPLGRGRLATPTPEQRARLLTAVASAAPAARQPATVRASCDGFQTGAARSGVLAGAEIRSFIAARCLALAGVQVICVRDAPDDLTLLRTRAAENRVFVLAVSATQAVVIGPDGDVRAAGDPVTGASAQVDWSEADVKRFTPETDLWAQRRVECYAFDRCG